MAAMVDASRPSREVPLAPSAATSDKSGNLFPEKPVLRRIPAIKRRSAPELTAARVLCNQLRNKRTRPDKQRIVHLICLNLQTILRNRSQQA